MRHRRLVRRDQSKGRRPAPVVADQVYVRFEEQRMQETFGEEFARYRRRVRRWLGWRRIQDNANDQSSGVQRVRETTTNFVLRSD